MFAASEDIDHADQDKVDTATTSLPTSTGIGTTAATSQGIVMVLLLPPLNGKSFARLLKGHMEKQETEMKRKLEMETGNGNWKQLGTKDAPITGAMFSS